MLKPKKFIVITTIYPPGRAVELFCQWPEWTVVIVGDRKTPRGWSHPNAIYLGLDEQHDFCSKLATMIPENTYGRKSLGYAYAMANGATAIFESDDDNIPYENACAVVDAAIDSGGHDVGARLASSAGWINIYRHFQGACWPRGLPLKYARSDKGVGSNGTDEKPWAVTQFLANGDPDVDAIYRLTDGSPTTFADAGRFTLDEASWCPFNSQATLWLPVAFPFMFLPIGISDRVTDILRGYMATESIWRTGNAVSYASAVVYQDRNLHDLLRDFKDEIPLYLNAERWTSELAGLGKVKGIAFFKHALEKFVEAGVFPAENIASYEAFLSAAALPPGGN